MLIKPPADLRASEITDEKWYLRRREFLQTAAFPLVAAAAGLPVAALAAGQAPLDNVRKGPFGTSEKLTPWDDVTASNNFYEFGTDKSDPARCAGTLKPRPWTVRVDGHVSKPADYQVEDLIRPHQLEERVYRMRCVEGWSMVIPWVGVPLGDLIKRFEPTSKAKFVEFKTLVDVRQMPGQRSRVLDWPYWRASGWMKPCTRSPFLPWACTAKCFRIRTARLSGWSSRGNAASRASSQS